MARTNKTDYVILGILSREPMSGYGMRQFIKETIGYFWQESYGQIYPALKRLAKDDCVTFVEEAQDGRPNRKVYSITDKGRDRLKEWLAMDYDPQPVRHELLLKMFFVSEGDKRRLIEQIEVLRDKQRQRLATFEMLEPAFEDEYDDYPEKSWWFATLRYGLHITRARLAWCDETLDSLRSDIE